MPLYMDIHKVDRNDLGGRRQGAYTPTWKSRTSYDVDYLKYWFNEDCGKLFCLVEAPSAEAARCVHEEAHGLIAEKLIEVDPELVDGFMGQSPVNSVGAALMPGATAEISATPAFATVMFTDIVDSTEMTSRFGDDAAMAMLAVA